MLTTILYSENSSLIHRFRHKTRSQVIYITLLLTVCAFVVSIFLIQIDVNLQSRGLITTVNKQSVVSSAIYGKVVKSNLKDNLFVTHGDTLVVIDDSELNQSISILREKLHLLDAEQRDLESLTIDSYQLPIEPDSFYSQTIKQEYRKLKADFAFLQADINSYKADYLRQKVLHSKNFISDSEFELSEYKYESARLKQQQMVEGQQAQWLLKFQNNKTQLLNLSESLITLAKELSKYYITSPVTGHIQQTIPLQTGSIVFPNQSLCGISPSEDLFIETYVTPKDIGFIHLEQEVLLRIDAFNSNQWGLLKAKVSAISHDITLTDNGELIGFRVLCVPLTTQLAYKGNIVEVKKGMTVTANFILTQRTLAQLLFDDISDWLNPNINNSQ